MSRQFGYGKTIPLIQSVSFRGDKIIIHLADKRVLFLPMEQFPEIEKLTPSQRRKRKLLAGTGLMFDDLDAVFHVSDFLGTANSSGFSLVAEPQTKYSKR